MENILYGCVVSEDKMLSELTFLKKKWHTFVNSNNNIFLMYTFAIDLVCGKLNCYSVDLYYV